MLHNFVQTVLSNFNIVRHRLLYDEHKISSSLDNRTIVLAIQLPLNIIFCQNSIELLIC